MGEIFLALVVTLIGVVRVEPAPYDILIVLCIIFIFWKDPMAFRKLFQGPAALILLGLFLLGNLLSLVNAEAAFQAVFYLAVTFYLAGTVIFWACWLRDEYRFELIVKGYLAASIIVLFLGFVSYLLDVGFLSSFVYGQKRMMSSFKDPNVFGSFLVPTLMLCFWLIGKKSQNGWRMKILTVFTVTGIIFSFSRGTWVGMAVSLFVYVIMEFHCVFVPNWKNYLQVAAGSFLIVCLMLSYTGRWDYALSRLGLQVYDAERFAVQAQGLQEALDMDRGMNGTVTPDIGGSNSLGGMEGDVQERGKISWRGFLGIGPGQFEVRYQYASHNLFIRVLRENGWVGLIGLLGFLIVLMWKLKINTGKDPEGVFSLLFSILAGFLVMSLVIDSLHWRHFWLFSGLAWGRIIEGR